MRWWSKWLGGGSDELGWDDLVRRVVEALAKHARYAERGRVVFPPDLLVRIEVDPAGIEVVRGFVDKLEFDREVGAALANQADCEPSSLPAREYELVAADRVRITASQGRARRWRARIEGGDRDGELVSLPRGRAELRLGRGDWHGADGSMRNDVVICDETSFVSRRAARLFEVGQRLEVEALDQGDNLFIRRESGEALRPARTARGRAFLNSGERIELSDGGEQAVRLVLTRVPMDQADVDDQS